MTVWSRPILRNFLVPQLRGINLTQARTCKGRDGLFHVVHSSFHWNKFKDLCLLHFTIAAIPVVAIIFYANVFIGPATLTQTPEGYEPKYWEYHSHPISRFFARYLTEDPQKTYEKLCFAKFALREQQLARQAETRVKYFIEERRDFQSWYYDPPYAKFARKRAADLTDSIYNSDRPSFPL